MQCVLLCKWVVKTQLGHNSVSILPYVPTYALKNVSMVSFVHHQKHRLDRRPSCRGKSEYCKCARPGSLYWLLNTYWVFRHTSAYGVLLHGVPCSTAVRVLGRSRLIFNTEHEGLINVLLMYNKATVKVVVIRWSCLCNWCKPGAPSLPLRLSENCTALTIFTVPVRCQQQLTTWSQTTHTHTHTCRILSQLWRKRNQGNVKHLDGSCTACVCVCVWWWLTHTRTPGRTAALSRWDVW